MTTTTAAALSGEAHNPSDTRFDDVAAAVRDQFRDATAAHGSALFLTDAADLFDIYLDALPPGQRQHHTCSTCRHFFNHYGSLVVIDDNGRTWPAMWPVDVVTPGFFAPAMMALRRAVASARVTGVFLSGEVSLGTASTPDPKQGTVWTHFAVMNQALFRSRAETAGQAMALKREHHGTLSRGVAEFGPEVVAQALTLLEGDTLYRTEKVIGPARFLHQLHETLKLAAGKDGRRNLIWRAVASAPTGFATPRSSMIGTLLEDLQADLPFDQVKAKFSAKMHPLQYQRPQVAASAGNIKQAEALVEKMGLAPALRRRFARLDECQAVWRPAPATPPADATSGLFGHLRAKGSASRRTATQTPPVPITWAKFARTVLPGALEMDLLLGGMMAYGAIVTAVDADAPPLFQWDRDDRRNPFSWYLYHGGTPARRWGLIDGGWVSVTAVVPKPSSWFADPAATADHHGEGAMLILQGAVDQDSRELALFPETLRADLHPVRKTIEQFSKTRSIEGADEASACGLIIGKTNDRHSIRVRSSTGVSFYRIDRWD